MALFCSCSHNRLEHIGGDLLGDSKVLKCDVQNCSCTKYHGSKDNDVSYIYKSFAFVLIFIGIGAGAIIFSSFAIDSTLSIYDIEPIHVGEKTFLVYENGTKVIQDQLEISPNEHLSQTLKTIIGMAIFFSFYIIGAMFIVPIFDADKRKAINSK